MARGNLGFIAGPGAAAALALSGIIACHPNENGEAGKPKGAPISAATTAMAAQIVAMPMNTAPLRAPETFASIADRDERARAIFQEASRVLLSPRCLNCHPNGDSPLQGDAHVIHDPPVSRGPNDEGIPALRCTTCHQETNLPLARVPGAPKWKLAPREMAWMGKSPGELCALLKDPNRNGNRTFEQLIDHSTNDKLVAWGWSPGSGRTPAPGTQAQFGALIAAWAKEGAACPQESADGGAGGGAGASQNDSNREPSK